MCKTANPAASLITLMSCICPIEFNCYKETIFLLGASCFPFSNQIHHPLLTLEVVSIYWNAISYRLQDFYPYMLPGLIISLFTHIQLTLPGTTTVCSTAYHCCLPYWGWKAPIYLFFSISHLRAGWRADAWKKKKHLLHITVSIFLPFPVLPSFITYSAFQNVHVHWPRKRNHFINFHLFSKASSPHTYPEVIPHSDSLTRSTDILRTNEDTQPSFSFYFFFNPRQHTDP